MRLHKLISTILALAVVCYAVIAQAVNIDLVPVGNPGNVGEVSGFHGDIFSGHGEGPTRICGAVDYNYNIGKYEVTAGQYTQFLNHKATVADTHGLYNTLMGDPTNFWGCNIQRSGGGTEQNPYTYSVASDWANRPVNYVSFWDAARFANWLNNGQNDGDTETGAYTLNDYTGIDGRAITRNSDAKWVLPSEDEWYKAAYHKNDGATGNYWNYPTMSDEATPPINTLLSPDPGNHANCGGMGTDPLTIGSPYYRTEVGDFEKSASPYGTFDQGGNVWEWTEAVVSEWDTSSAREVRGGSFSEYTGLLLSSIRHCDYPSSEDYAKGFRVASVGVPEPGSAAMLAGIALTVLLYWSRKRA